MADTALLPRVGVVTMINSYNYGNRVQNYAMTRVWEKTGFKVASYDFTGDPLHRRVRNKVRNIVKGKPLAMPAYGSGSSPERFEAFSRFDSAHMRLEVLHKSVPLGFGKHCDLFSVGSDQVWNPNWKPIPSWKFLQFAPSTKRVALCPSVGVDVFPQEKADVYRRGLAGFAELSVREESGAAIIRQLTGRQATVLADPTLMLTPAEWRAVADGRLTPAGPYVFAYLLGADSPQRAQALEALADGRQVIQISDRDDGTELPAGPAEFIDLVDHAALVVTDSFHACVFATLLATPLVAVPRAGGEGMSGRIDTLAAKLGLARQAVEGSPYPAERLVPGEDLDARLAAERGKFGAYLHGVLESRGFHEQAQLAWSACNAEVSEEAEGAACAGDACNADALEGAEAAPSSVVGAVASGVDAADVGAGVGAVGAAAASDADAADAGAGAADVGAAE